MVSSSETTTDFEKEVVALAVSVHWGIVRALLGMLLCRYLCTYFSTYYFAILVPLEIGNLVFSSLFLYFQQSLRCCLKMKYLTPLDLC